MQIHASVSKLESLMPSKPINTLLTQLVKLCSLPSSIEISTLPNEVQLMRQSLIKLCGIAEGFLELEFSTFLTNVPRPLDHLDLFPYYNNYVLLAGLEHSILVENGVEQPKKVAFIGSGPLPLTAIIMATHHMQATYFVNIDIDESANHVASQIVATDLELERRMKFETCDVMDVKEMLGSGALLVRSANGARAFLYPVVEEEDLEGFEVLSVFHPTNEVINSIVLARKPIFG
ncbi:hypothetical protein Scep_023348 [Stephania cephalantha]|uniref:Nicotianamine synthase n=1 Tax=Stephania cephalantha TaxID=152367 RepID=A0AAP0F016_9MAGN